MSDFAQKALYFAELEPKKLEPRMFDSAPGAWFYMEIRTVEIRTASA